MAEISPINAVLPVVYIPQDIDNTKQNYLRSLLSPFGITLSFRQPEQAYFLQLSEQRLALCQMGHREKVWADFTGGTLRHRVVYRGTELIAKALNIKENHTIWDATAGLGRDAFVLAALGARVYMFERHFVPAALLADALKRAEEVCETHAITQRMSLIFGSISDEITPLPDAIYLDPMFPERRKTALVKKEMQFFQAAIGEDNDSAALLDKARSLAVKRIVVKRPKHGAFIDNIQPAYQYVGKSTRFDIYLPKK